ncbi:CueP family metal-binding protein [Homoserinimonas sp. OAct 916]|uniref:CueP family metal-binding protein n=1 Tax=Homoserinimonas sp. OAct 916 TaxID=2211450 RepID=UPI000DBEA95E|nr:CueP family metal-binding protein [Homoserinimonas sp. OAct 916]
MPVQHNNRARRHTPPSVIAALVIAVLALTGCSSPVAEHTPPASGDAIIADHGLEGLDAKQIIEKLDTMLLADRPSDLIASVRPRELLLTDDQERASTVPMPDDEFYVSLAPYVDHTHECFFHSLTTCRGELQNEDIDVTVVDDATAETVIDQTLRTYDNGFIGLWLPRGLNATLTIQHEGRTVTSAISTISDEDPTCLTALRLL